MHDAFSTSNAGLIARAKELLKQVSYDTIGVPHGPVKIVVVG